MKFGKVIKKKSGNFQNSFQKRRDVLERNNGVHIKISSLFKYTDTVDESRSLVPG